jgi:hypothetical protein
MHHAERLPIEAAQLVRVAQVIRRIDSDADRDRGRKRLVLAAAMRSRRSRLCPSGTHGQKLVIHLAHLDGLTQ